MGDGKQHFNEARLAKSKPERLGSQGVADDIVSGHHQHLTHASEVREKSVERLHLPEVVQTHGFLPLVLSTILAEVAGNMIYVALLERAYQLAGHAGGVGNLLIVQTVPQVLLGVWAGMLVDYWGKCRAAVLATLANAILAVALIRAQTTLGIYVLAFLIMLTRLVLIPARSSLVSCVSKDEHLITTNMTISVVTGATVLIGPAAGAATLFVTKGFDATFIAAALGLLLSALALSFVKPPSTVFVRHTNQRSVWQQIHGGWQFLREHSLVWEVFLCLINYALVFGAVMPLLTPLAHQLGLGLEGTGIFFSAMGLGSLVGAPLAIILFRRLSKPVALMLTGLLVPSGVVGIGLADGLNGTLVALILTALSGTSLNVITITILQELIPSEKHGMVFGIAQTVMGAAWSVSLAVTTAAMMVQPEMMNTAIPFLVIGGAGLLLVMAYGIRHWRQLEIACQLCEPPSQVMAAICQAICKSGFRTAGTACQAICGHQRYCSS